MSVSLPNLSGRLLRAASAEQADLVRHRERLTDKRSALLDELRALDEGLAATDRRLEVLAELVGRPPAGAASGDAPERDAPERDAPERNGAEPKGADRNGADPNGADRDGADRDAAGARTPTGGIGPASAPNPSLRGPAIREAAVRVLLAQPQPIEALHYRRWYELLTDAGYRVAGKDPLAVFLTQLSRSPVVRKSSQPGVYELDRQAPTLLRRRLDRLQAELREVTVAASGPIELADVRARRHELDLAISQQERALEEALRVLRSSQDESAIPAPVSLRT